MAIRNHSNKIPREHPHYRLSVVLARTTAATDPYQQRTCRPADLLHPESQCPDRQCPESQCPDNHPSVLADFAYTPAPDGTTLSLVYYTPLWRFRGISISQILSLFGMYGIVLANLGAIPHDHTLNKKGRLCVHIIKSKVWR